MRVRYEYVEKNLYRMQGPTPQEKRLRVAQFFNAGVEAESKGCDDAAIQLYWLVLSNDPTFPPAWVNLGTIYYKLRKFRRASRCYRKAVAADPCYAMAWFNLGNAVEELGAFWEAVKWYRRALALAPEYADAHFNLAVVYEKVGEMGKAIIHYRQYLKCSIGDGALWRHTAQGKIRKLSRWNLRIVPSSAVVTTTTTIAPQAAQQLALFEVS